MPFIMNINQGHNTETNLINFNGEAIHTGAAEDVIDYLTECGYQCVIRPEDHLKPGSERNFEISPPLTEEHIKGIGDLCLQPSHGSEGEITVLDNRNTIPEGIAA